MTERPVVPPPWDLVIVAVVFALALAAAGWRDFAVVKRNAEPARAFTPDRPQATPP